METRVVRNAAAHRYEIQADGAVAGFTEYEERPGILAFTHTEIDERLEGHGLASTLIGSALDDARDRGLAVLPYCPFVKGFIGPPPPVRRARPRGAPTEVRPVKRYAGEEIAVTFDTRRCLHAAECVRELPSVFDTPSPALDPSRRRCPRTRRRGGAPLSERRAGLRMDDARGTAPSDLGHFAARRAALGPRRAAPADGRRRDRSDARRLVRVCGATGNAPFCDASGDCTAWRGRPADGSASGP